MPGILNYALKYLKNIFRLNIRFVLVILLTCSPILYITFYGLPGPLDLNKSKVRKFNHHLFDESNDVYEVPEDNNIFIVNNLTQLEKQNSATDGRNAKIDENNTKLVVENIHEKASNLTNALNHLRHQRNSNVSSQGKLDQILLDSDRGDTQVKPDAIPKHDVVLRHHLDNDTRLQEIQMRSKSRNLCPLWPKELIGQMDIKADITLNELRMKPETLSHIEKGGTFKPTGCEPREKTAVIVPYRDRQTHLELLLHHIHTVLQRQKIEYAIYVIEMAYPTQFNRGLLANVGFLTAASISEYTCYVIHDVDLVMIDDRNMYRCGRVPRHLTAYNSKFNYNLPYLSYFGGVDAFTPDQYWRVNGFSNLFFGWGGEDDDMVARIIYTGLHFSRPNHQIGGYIALQHDRDSANPPNPHRVTLQFTAGKRLHVDGVRSVKYNRLALEFKQLYTWVYIGVKEAKIMEKYQEYLQPPEPDSKEYIEPIK